MNLASYLRQSIAAAPKAKRKKDGRVNDALDGKIIKLLRSSKLTRTQVAEKLRADYKSISKRMKRLSEQGDIQVRGSVYNPARKRNTDLWVAS